MYSHLEQNIPELVALVYRVSTGCRQYAFSTVDKLEEWSNGYPYRDEKLLIMAFNDCKPCGKGVMVATDAACFVSRCLAGF